MNHYRLNRVSKFAFIFLGSVGTILFIRVGRPMFPFTNTSPVERFLNFALGLFGFGLIVAAVASGIAVVYCLLRRPTK